MHAILKISGNYSLSDATWMENTQLQMVLSFKTSFCLYNEVLLWKQKLLKMGSHFYLLSVNITSPQKQSFQTLQVRGSWESSLLILYPSNSSLPPNIFFKSCLVHQKNIETLRAPEEGGEGNPKRTNFGHKCFKASIFHIDYDFEVHLIIFYHSHFS